jgi:hypothetical protein
MLVAWCGGIGSLYDLRLADLGSRYSGPDLASANASFIMLYSLGMLGGPPIAGFGMDLVPPNGFFFSVAALLVLFSFSFPGKAAYSHRKNDFGPRRAGRRRRTS